MPHLAPLMWSLAPLLFWVLLLSVTATIWWFPTFYFPSAKSFTTASHFSSRKWHWA